MDNQYVGIIGTVIGSVSTLITSEIIKHFGRTKIFLRKLLIKTDTYGNVGCMCGDKTADDLYGLGLKCDLEFYNGSNIPKMFHNFYINFYINNRLVKKVAPNDEDTRVSNSHGSRIDGIKAFSIKAKEVYVLRLSMYLLDNEGIQELDNVDKIVLEYNNSSNRKKTFTIYRGKIKISRNEEFNYDVTK